MIKPPNGNTYVPVKPKFDISYGKYEATKLTKEQVKFRNIIDHDLQAERLSPFGISHKDTN